MNEHQNGPLENLFQGIDKQTGLLTQDELKAELRERGMDVERFIRNVRATVAAAQKEHRLSWMKVADDKKMQIETCQSAFASWLGKTEQEIKAAFAQLTKTRTAVAFRNKTELSIEDMAKLLDDDERLRLRQSAVKDSQSE